LFFEVCEDWVDFHRFLCIKGVGWFLTGFRGIAGIDGFHFIFVLLEEEDGFRFVLFICEHYIAMHEAIPFDVDVEEANHQRFLRCNKIGDMMLDRLGLISSMQFDCHL
jgi:hypothetical protein